MFNTIQNSVMFGCRTHRYPTSTTNDSGDRRVITLGTTTSEDDLARLAPNDIGDHIARLINALAGLSGKTVRAGRIGENLGQKREHGLNCLGSHWRSCRMIEVDKVQRHPLRVPLPA